VRSTKVLVQNAFLKFLMYSDSDSRPRADRHTRACARREAWNYPDTKLKACSVIKKSILFLDMHVHAKPRVGTIALELVSFGVLAGEDAGEVDTHFFEPEPIL
jgi:hypothetical protein